MIRDTRFFGIVAALFAIACLLAIALGRRSVPMQCAALELAQARHDLAEIQFEQYRLGVDSQDTIKAAYDRIPPPPSRSASAWYGDHCWHGRPR